MRVERFLAAVLLSPAHSAGFRFELPPLGPRSARCVATICSDRVLLQRARHGERGAVAIRPAHDERALLVVDAAVGKTPLDELPPWRVGRWAVAATAIQPADDAGERERVGQIARSIGPGDSTVGAAELFRRIQLQAHPDAPSYPGALLAAAMGSIVGQLGRDGLLVAGNGRVLGVCAVGAPIWIGRVANNGVPVANAADATAFVAASWEPAGVGWERIERGLVWWDPAVGVRVDQVDSRSGGAGA